MPGARNSCAGACKPLAPPLEIWHCAPPPDRTGLLSLLDGAEAAGAGRLPMQRIPRPQHSALERQAHPVAERKGRHMLQQGAACPAIPPGHGAGAMQVGRRVTGAAPLRGTGRKMPAARPARDTNRRERRTEGQVRFTGQRQGERPFDGRAGLLDHERARPERRRTVPAQEQRGQT